MLPDQAAMAHHLTHHHPIFLLDEALVPFLIWASSREGDLLTHTIGSHFFVDKLSTIVGIDSQDGKRKACPGTLESGQNRLRPTVEQGETFRPPGGDIGQRDGVEAATLQSSPTVDNQIHLQEAWCGLIPLGEGADRDLLFQQGASLGGRKAMGVGVAMGLQKTISGGCAQREKLAPVFLAKLYM